jgi:hypothetical protein
LTEKAVISPALERGEKVYILWEGYNMLDCFMANYEFTPLYFLARVPCSNYERPFPEPSRTPDNFLTETLNLTPFNDRNAADRNDQAYDLLFIPRGNEHVVNIIGSSFANPGDILNHKLFYRRGGKFYPAE